MGELRGVVLMTGRIEGVLMTSHPFLIQVGWALKSRAVKFKIKCFHRVPKRTQD